MGENSIVDNFGAFNWRPDSETVASRAFARASITMSLEVGILSIRHNTFESRDQFKIFWIHFSTLAVFGPEGADSLG